MEYETKSDIVTRELRDLIRSGELPAGTALRQRDVATRFGVSPTPVREALRRLQSEGYLDAELHREATVVSVEPGRVQEDLLIMANLESLAAALAARRATDADLVEIEQLAHGLTAPSLSNSELHDLNQRFHFRIYECARSPILLSLLRLLWRSATAKTPMAVRRDEMVAEHRAIIDALRDRSPTQAAERTQRHIMASAPSD